MPSKQQNDIWPFFEPESVAVIGSLSEPFSLGYVTIRNLLQFGFKGRIHPINPVHSEVHGLKAYSNIRDVEDRVDLAVVITPAATVPEVVDQCARKGVRAALVVSENFAEVDREGAELQRQLVEIRRCTGIRIMGPNTIGLLNAANGFACCAYLISYEKLRKGGVAYFGQSGFVGPAAQPLADRALPISKICDAGNKCDVNEVDIINYLAEDPETKVVVMHLEDIRDGRAFIEAARHLIARKPLLVLKPGQSEEGATAMVSHTGSLAGNAQIYDGAFKQAGAIRLNTWREFWEVPKYFESQPPPHGNRLVINTMSGGAGVLGVDKAVEAGLTLASLTPATVRKLLGWSPKLRGNPVDMGPILSISGDPYSLQVEIMSTVINDPNVDCATVPAYIGFDGLIPIFLDLLDRLKELTSKPFVVWVYGMQLSLIEEMVRLVEGRGLPAYCDLDTAIKALGVAARYRRIKEDLGNI